MVRAKISRMAGFISRLGDGGTRLWSRPMTKLSSWFQFIALVGVGILLDVLCRFFPAQLPFWMPWEFSWPEYLACTLTLAWFVRGLLVMAPGAHPPKWRQACFVVGIISFYVVLQTHVDYYAQHMFFVHRWAHFVLHHAGAFLIALGMSGPVLLAGMPDFLKPLVRTRAVQSTLSFLQHPAVAPALFVGLLYFWLTPPSIP